MIVNMYSVYDEKAETFASPFCMLNDGQATRAFGDACQDKSSQMYKHPSDYKLYKLGEFDDNSGHIVTLDIPKLLNNASEFIAEVK